MVLKFWVLFNFCQLTFCSKSCHIISSYVEFKFKKKINLCLSLSSCAKVKKSLIFVVNNVN